MRLACGAVKTRTLLLLALGCGLLIMLAGAIFLFQLSGQDDADASIPIGEPATVGDMTVAVEEATESGAVLEVMVSIGGVDDPDGADGFHLFAGVELSPEPAVEGDACSATTVAEQRCVLRFDLSDAEGSSRVVFYARGDERAAWVLP